MDTHRYQMDINYFGTLNAIHAVTPGMIEKQEGHIVLISSAVCFAPMIGYVCDNSVPSITPSPTEKKNGGWEELSLAAMSGENKSAEEPSISAVSAGKVFRSFSNPGVSNVDGKKMVMRMPSRFSSFRKQSAKPRSAYFEGQ